MKVLETEVLSVVVFEYYLCKEGTLLMNTTQK